MEVSEVLPRAHFHLPRTLNSLLAPDRYTCRDVSVRNVCRFALSVGTCCSLMSPVMSVKKGHSVTTSKELCSVVWTIEADLEVGQLLYVTGEPLSLGVWQPNMALPMSRTEHENLWETEVMIPSGVNLKYNYFIKDERQPSGDLIWRPGPEFSLSIPLDVKQDRKIMVKDSWLKYNIKRYPPEVWDSWIGEMDVPVQPLISAETRDEHQIVTNFDVNLEKPKEFLNNLKSDDESYVSNKHISGAKDSRQNLVFSERDQPLEEPWLLERSIILLVTKDEIMPDKLESNDTADNNAMQYDDGRQHLQVKDMLSSDNGTNLILKDDSVSTIILINSSICTMQRIAVLEEEKLVELLLEPVKTNVQSDSVYLGVVTKFVPHMGGAFVNIGHSRPSLMDIKQNREPFIFPPFNQKTKKGKVIGSGLESSEEHQDVEDINDVAEFISPKGLIPFLQDDHEEHDADEDFDISDVKDNVNGSIVDYGQANTNIVHLLGGVEQHLEGEVKNRLVPLETEGSNGSLISHPEDRKDSDHRAYENKWIQVRKGTKIVVQVVKEGLGTKGPTLTAYPKLRSRFWVLHARCDRIGISKKILGIERTRLRVIAKTLQPAGFGLTARTVASGQCLEELQKDLEGLLSTWKNILEHAKSAALAADEGIEGAIPVILHRAMGQTLSVVQDYFNEKVKKMVVDSPRTYHEVTNYLQEIAPDLCDRVELYDRKVPLFDDFKIEDEINNIISKRVQLPKGGSLVIEQTEALVSIDVNGGHVMFGQGTSQEKAILDVNLEAAKQIARELRLRDIGGIIVVDFIDMVDDC
ncbi:ribonuclease E/G-like protein, chloroplastic isoform X2 [Mercurialis annua]|uniref:ribonuclease E/G-like protein, chloroplastic isoform X2 n=1 Tax=Mercurialis annua TaxID=3986 RepID=UPI0024AE85AB|nr:ribonuclease E/G-like protein, chloroplastic isoform X2 [Mercurialis annua]